MNTMTKMLVCSALMALLGGTTGCEEVAPFTIVVSPGTQAPDEMGSDTGEENSDSPDEMNDPDEEQDESGESGSEENDMDESGTEQNAAAELEQRLSGTRITFLRSQSNGSVFTNAREDIDLCSSGEFQLRFVTQVNGYGYANEDVYESLGTWRIIVEGSQLMLELSTQQDTNGYVGVDKLPFQVAGPTDLNFSGDFYGIQANSPLCD